MKNLRIKRPSSLINAYDWRPLPKKEKGCARIESIAGGGQDEARRESGALILEIEKSVRCQDKRDKRSATKRGRK